MYKRDLDLLNILLLHLYFQNYIIMEEIERIANEEDPNSGPTTVNNSYINCEIV
jgi:hypothetical protein